MQHFHIAIALIWRDDKVLATRRHEQADHLPGVWEFPGGKCEDGELPRECVLREAREEIGVDIAVMKERPPITFDYPERRVTLYPFDCVIVAGEPQPLQVAALRWLARHELQAEEFPAANAGLIAEIKNKGHQL
ncbi:MAG: (deoxy)nucleoside triphosphate pyrophosphohydrolase [Armatimonadota bacterium]|nr:(deoxy)nucleoside triphosphate pyrophosphohydrolase [Armatimonadota bacterium]